MDKSVLREKELLSAKDLQTMGVGRGMAYSLLSRSDMPVVIIGGRKFMHKDLFMKWLERKAGGLEEQATINVQQ